MKKLPYFSRELSWLDFNQRIIELAQSTNTPLLERLKFFSISNSNLDEFYMVRIGGLQQCTQTSSKQPEDPSGLNFAAQLKECGIRLKRMHHEQDSVHEDIMSQLQQKGIIHENIKNLDEFSLSHLEKIFENEILPVISPLSLGDSKDFSIIFNRHQHIIVRLEQGAKNGSKIRFAALPITRNLARFIILPTKKEYRFILIEELISLFAHRFFPGEKIAETSVFRAIRNADLSIREDEACDLLSEMEEVLNARKHGHFACLHINHLMSKTTSSFLIRSMGIHPEFVFSLKAPLDGSAFMNLAGISGFEHLRNTKWSACSTIRIPAGKTIFNKIAEGNMLLYHPFESFEPVVRLVSDAAIDPDVLAIKQILYRTGSKSSIVEALMRAARNGKNVTAIVELKARFDEARNIEWARELEDAGVHVIYGIKGLKTHAKICLVVRREPAGIVRYMHFGTGNYNEITAGQYCDLSFLTADPDLGADSTAFFNAITGYSQPQDFRKIDAAPLGLRQSVTDLIRNEIEHKKQGHKAFIRAKMNSLVDPAIIAELYKASQAGVSISLNIRGICCLVPGVAKISENITVTSIVDRYLEHARIMHFCNGNADKVYISTADWMPRNLDRRVELLVPIEDKASQTKILSILNIYNQDTSNAWKLTHDGSWKKIVPLGKKLSVNAQETIYKATKAELEKIIQKQPTFFEPHKA